MMSHLTCELSRGRWGGRATGKADQTTQRSSGTRTRKTQCKQQWEKVVTHKRIRGLGRTPKRKKAQGVGGGGLQRHQRPAGWRQRGYGGSKAY